MTQKWRYEKILEWFRKNVAEAKTELHYKSDYQLLVAVILSAQCTDKRVNIVTEKLFEKYPDVFAMAQATAQDILLYINSISYPNNKSKHLVAMAKMVVAEFGGKIPSDTEQLQKLQGVGRKTANVIASVLYNQPKMAVDTHVFRVARRMGLSTGKNPLQVENELVSNIPQDEISKAHHWLILHGRYICTARTPKCVECGVSEWCEYFEKNR
ncbi:MAG: endonuclease III [Prevotellaceae bacterium]|jgi:endonuclease-3|nr:endonuclease III [Prevotellaceae bacterium]